MTRTSITMLMVFFVVLATVAAPLAAKTRIEFEQTEVDFGELEAGKSTDVEFKFSNIGDETLIIKNINSSCGCTVPKLDKKEYAPGEKGVIPVKFFSKGYNGKVVKSITVSTNDEENVYTTLKIKGNVVLKDFAMAEITPDKIDFGSVKPGKEYTKKITIKNEGTIDLRVIDITHTPELYLKFPVKAVEPGKSAEVKVVFKPMEGGRYVSFTRIRTNAYKRSTWIVKVSADVEEKK